jgi:putative transport protein
MWLEVDREAAAEFGDALEAGDVGVVGGGVERLEASDQVGHAGGRLLRLPAAQLAGMMAGVSTQPAVLAYASAHAAEEDEVLVGYATVYPLVMIVKIVAVQFLITTLT